MQSYQEEKFTFRNDVSSDLANRVKQLEQMIDDMTRFNQSFVHEVNSSLSGIHGLSDLLLQDYIDELSTLGKDHLLLIKNTARNAFQLSEDLLKLSQLSSVQLRKTMVDLTQLSKDVSCTFLKLHPNRKIKFIIADSLFAVVDPNLFRIFFQNLISNAVKFTVHQQEAIIEIGMYKNKNIYFVKDNGCGFDPFLGSKLFNPFQRLHAESDFSGTGMGLNIVKKIIEFHGGKVWADSKIGEGASFFFVFSDSVFEK